MIFGIGKKIMQIKLFFLVKLKRLIIQIIDYVRIYTVEIKINVKMYAFKTLTY